MIKKYCYKCGYGTEYTLKKPNFCSKCGNSFELPSVSNSKININNINNNIDNIEDIEENDDNLAVPHIDKLEFDEIINIKSSGEKLKDIISTSKNTGKTLKKSRSKSPKITESEAKKMAQEVLNEGKTLRRKK